MFLKMNSLLLRFPSSLPRRNFSSYLIKNKAYVNGKWVSSGSGETFSVENPSGGSFLSNLPDMSGEEAEKAVASAYEAFQSWKMTSFSERSDLLKKLGDLCKTNIDELGRILTLEQGKPIDEAKKEIAYGISYLEWFSEEAKRAYGDVVPSSDKTKKFIVVRQPVGVAAMITPWNFPNAMMLRKVAAALAAGCTCVIKPSPDTPLSALAFAQLSNEVGIPDGVINVITTSKNLETVSNAICESSLVRALSFTGSTRVGKLLYEKCAPTVKRLSLELGGNAPFIVFESADLDLAVKGCIASKFRNAGQTCVCSNRIFLQSSIYEAFMEKFVAVVKETLVLGDGMKSTTNIGPIINERQLQNIQNLVGDAISKGASVKFGGKKSDIGELFYEPTILEGVTPNMSVYQEEIFGPVASIIQFKTEEEVIKLANDTNYGLAGYFFSKDVSQCWRVASKLDIGMVGINEGLLSASEVPFGGVKQSGIGREGSKYGLDEYTDLKYMCFGGL